MYISKELFTKCINHLRITDDFQNGVNDLINKINKQPEICGCYCDLGTMIYPDCALALLDLLSFVMNDTDGIIVYFCYDITFGRDWEEGCFNDIRLSTIDDLWNYLVCTDDQN